MTLKYPDLVMRDNLSKILSLASLILGVAFFGLVAVFLGALATGAGSIPLLGALWVFTPAPVVFAWPWWSKGRASNFWLRKAATAYLTLGVVMSVIALAGVGWIASERGIHPRLCNTGDKSLSDYVTLEPKAQLVTFPVPETGQRVGWFVPGESQATVILLHGFGCRRQEMLDHAQVLNQAGYSVLLFDFHGQGDSDGDAVTLGFREQQDLLAVVDYLKARDDVDQSNIGVLGISMGASVAIMGAAQSPDIKAVIADSPFESASRAIEEGFTRVIGLPAFPFAPITLQIIEWRLGVSPDRVVPRDHIAAISPRPLLLIHGLADTEVSPANSEILFAAAGEPRELWLVPDIDHTRGMQDRREEYSERIVQFFDQHLD
jgi:fermentation-respiration switch protein FrsA (DUF1100 family)